MAKYTNSAPGMRGINLKDGTTRWVEPDETVEIDEAKVAQLHSAFGGDGSDGLERKSVAELKRIAEEENTDLGDATKKADIIAAIQLGREPKA